MAFTKLQRDVADIYEQLDAAERGMSYEELAATFVELGLFKTTSALPTAADDSQVPPPLTPHPSPTLLTRALTTDPKPDPNPRPYP